MALSTATTPSPAILDIIHDGKTSIGQALMDVDGFWYYYPVTNGGWSSSHNLRQIADLLDGLNAPYEKELAAYFDSLPKEMDRAVQDDFLPF
jgi:hypothetical protein